MTLFTSDGNPGTVTIPNRIPADVEDQFDPDWAQAYGMVLIRYDLPDHVPGDTTDPGGNQSRTPGCFGPAWVIA